eukprot:CAMPEP_0197520942 /NCGR_PEP_ID=MMETSP1318-20131121/6261_1 /TAXON_ID=552666 /ORGANISM="Partenskyella glossopodia, Strain RCC365" /LENGTH=222 /DNA_ID=CAMNT_0043072725 /DNA_START=44 /DNA_END=712 /DNA_ORIENTATION=-
MAGDGPQNNLTLMTIIHHNVRKLTLKRWNQLQEQCQQAHDSDMVAIPDIITLNETGMNNADFESFKTKLLNSPTQANDNWIFHSFEGKRRGGRGLITAINSSTFENVTMNTELSNERLQILVSHVQHKFTGRSFSIINFYQPPKNGAQATNTILGANGLEKVITELKNKPFLLAGDANAQSHLWDHKRKQNRRGQALATLMRNFRLNMLNDPDVPTSVRNND